MDLRMQGGDFSLDAPFSEDEKYRCKAFYNGEFQAMSYNGVDSYARKLNDEDREGNEYKKIYDFLTEKMGKLTEVDDYQPPTGKTASEVRGIKVKTREEKLNDIAVLPKPDIDFRGGAVKLGEDDWPGYFMRGDECVGVIMQISYILNTLTDSSGRYFDNIPTTTAFYLDLLMDWAFHIENDVILTERDSLIASCPRWKYLNRKKA